MYADPKCGMWVFGKKKLYRHKTSSEFFLFLLRQHFFICTLPYRRACTSGSIYTSHQQRHRTHIPESAHLSTISYHTSYQVLTQPNGIIQLEEAKKEEEKKNCYLSIGFPILVSNYFSFRLFFSTYRTHTLTLAEFHLSRTWTLVRIVSARLMAHPTICTLYHHRQCSVWYMCVWILAW